MMQYVEKINRKERFGLARYGDGEFEIMMAGTGQNCDGVVYTHELLRVLMSTIENPKDYDYGIVAIARHVIGASVLQRWIERNAAPEINWVDGTQFKDASFDQNIEPLIDALCQVQMLYVGPPRLTNSLHKLFPGTDMIQCNPCRAFEERDLLQDTVLYHLENYEKLGRYKPDVIGFSCGPATKGIIHRLWDHTPGISLIDFGSLWDGYLGFPSRTYMISTKFRNYASRVLEKYSE